MRRAGRAALLAGTLLPAALVAVFVAVFLWSAPASAGAQEVVREVQVPLAPERGIVEVDAALRRELGVFPGVEGFVAARLFETAGSGWVLELTLREEGRTVRERRRMSDDELAGLRERITAGLAARGMDRAVSRDGRGGLVIAQTGLGLAFYGWAVPAVLDIDSQRGAVAAYLLTAGASFLVPYRLTRRITVTDAHRDAVVWGGTRGIAYGLLVGDALTLDDDESFDGESDERVVLGLGLATSVAGSVLGYQAVDPASHDRGDVALWSTGGDFALAYGFGTAMALGLYDAERECFEDVCVDRETEATAAGHLTTAALGLAGLYGARKWSEVRDYTVGDARALLSFGLLGGQVALPAAWALFQDVDDGERALAASVVAGSAAGLWLGDGVLERRSLSSGEGLLVQAGHAAGGLLAAGLTYLLDDDGDEDELLYMTTTAAGSVAGSLLTFRAIADANGGPARPGSARGAPGTPGVRRGPTLEIDTAGLWTALLARDAARPVRVPVVTVRH